MSDHPRVKVWKDGGRISFDCPGCKDKHIIPVNGNQSNGHGWSWNGSVELPTLTPSINAKSGHHADSNYECYCNMSQRIPDADDHPEWCYICHSFVTDGKIQFLTDCTHPLAGQTVDLPPVKDPQPHD